MTIGNAIKLIRTARGMRQRDLAGELQVSPNYLSMLEADRRLPSIGFLRKLASRLQVPAGLFLLWTEASKSSLRKKQAEQVRELLIRIQAIYLEDATGESVSAR